MDSSDELDAELPAPQIRAGSPARTPGMATFARSVATTLGSETKSGVQRKLLAYDMSGKWAKINIRLFLNSMPVKSPRSFKQPDYTNVFNLIPEEGTGSRLVSEIHLPWIQVHSLRHEIRMDDKGKNKVDVGLHKTAGAPKDGRPNWINQSMWIEFKKKGNGDDAFNDSEQGPFEVESSHAAQVRGQLISYAEMAMNRQHRTHLYSVFVMHKFARLIRWDRAGAVVSEKFDYRENPEILGEFFWRFSHMTDEAQGYDPTAQLLNPLLPEPFDYIRQQFKDSLKEDSLKEDADKVDWPRYKLAVEDKEKGMRYFLVGRCHGQSPDLVGRATRTYVAIDVETETFVHLKDQWREGQGGVEPREDGGKRGRWVPLRPGELHLEGDILSHLNKTSVRNVPTMLCHGDVGGQVTVTRDVWRQMPERLRKASSSMDSAGDKRHPPSKLVHYRLVEKEVGQPLSEFKKSLELLMRMRWNSLGSFIETLAPENMLMYPVEVTNLKGVTKHVWTGLLNDWELSKPIARPGTVDRARREGRTGTWQFMSSAILDDKCRRPIIEDELESFFYVLVYYGVRYLEHNSEDVASFMLAFFDSYSFSNGEYSCGSTKRSAIHHGELKWPDGRDVLFTGEGSHPHPLNDLIATMLPWFQGRYRLMELQQKRRKPSSSGTHVEAQGESENNEYADFVMDEDLQDANAVNSTRQKDMTNADSDEVTFATAASNLYGHRAMRQLLRQAVKTAIWPSKDKVGDQLPKEYTSKRARGSGDEDAATTGEKRRQEDILATDHLRKRPKQDVDITPLASASSALASISIIVSADTLSHSLTIAFTIYLASYIIPNVSLSLPNYFHKFARLVRWDRAGAVVSEKFNYKAHPEILGEFFWRFSHMTDEAQGYDPTAQLVNPRTKLFRLMDTMAEKALPEPFDYIRQQFKDSLKAEWPRYKLAVEDKEKGRVTSSLGVSWPIA
ncbi:hypothetical protein A0H81_06292 [Grifola frondosa]|uniref:Fungal-type protein kinase domain-containing protein n=1 Tax=Grifola frondosa TaxID=5627 RepID=A0A1C7MB50_GRIFR|nr:hypothetical protein A0H81_06292 [Grifola frondosa]